MSRLVLTDRLTRLPDHHQIVPLPDRRLLVRHAGGITLLRGVSKETLSRVLEQVDGHRTVGEICERLSEEFRRVDVLVLLEQLRGDLVRLVAEKAEPVRPGGRNAVLFLAEPHKGVKDWAQGLVRASGARMDFCPLTLSAEERGMPRLPSSLVEALARRFESADVVVCVPGVVTYGLLFQFQESCRRVGLPLLICSADPDGVRLGPLIHPVVGGCFGCAQQGGFGFLGLSSAELISALTAISTRKLKASERQWAGHHIQLELKGLFQAGAFPRLVGATLHYRNNGSTRHDEVHPTQVCSLCGSTPAPPTTERSALISKILLSGSRHFQRRAHVTAPPSDRNQPMNVGVLGGGTAGYLTAMALRRKLPHLRVTLLESSKIPIIGVGEATTPLMLQFLHVDLGLDIHEFFRCVQPTLKLGVRFLWGPERPGCFNYPFGPNHVLEPFVHEGHVLNCSQTALFMNAGKLPMGKHPGLLPHFGTRVGYHLDNRRFVVYLQKKAADFGIHRIDCEIEQILKGPNPDEIARLIDTGGKVHSFDLYIDCSGFRSLLMGQTLQSPFIGYEKSLFTDRAIVAVVPNGGRLNPYTIAEAMAAGWCWNTPQRNGDHRGYVFCSQFMDDAAAEAEMRAKNPGMGECRMIRFRPGRHDHFWKGNVVAMGNAYGFVEPLESTALHMLIRQIGFLVGAFPSRAESSGMAEILNRKVSRYWDYLCWFLAIHFKFNSNPDTAFWRACRDQVDISRHEELIRLFLEGGPLSYQPAMRAHFDYPDPLWGAEGIDLVLLGQGVAEHLPGPSLGREAWQRALAPCRALLEAAPDQKEGLALLQQQPELLEALLQSFRSVGPAFGRGSARPHRG